MKLKRISIIIIIIISLLILSFNFGIDFLIKRDYKIFQKELAANNIHKIIFTKYLENNNFNENINIELNDNLKNKLLNLLSIVSDSKGKAPKLYFYQLSLVLYTGNDKYSFIVYKEKNSNYAPIQYENSYTSLFFSVDDNNGVVEEIIGFLHQ